MINIETSDRKKSIIWQMFLKKKSGYFNVILLKGTQKNVSFLYARMTNLYT
jgi:hypothetical protein